MANVLSLTIPSDGRAVQGSAVEMSARRQQTPAVILPSGKVPPPEGKPLPQEPAKVEVKAPDLSGVVQNLNQYLKSSQRDLMFRVDEGSGRLIITVLNPETGEIVRQIPPEEVLSLARNLREAGILFDTRA